MEEGILNMLKFVHRPNPLAAFVRTLQQLALAAFVTTLSEFESSQIWSKDDEILVEENFQIFLPDLEFDEPNESLPLSTHHHLEYDHLGQQIISPSPKFPPKSARFDSC